MAAQTITLKGTGTPGQMAVICLKGDDDPYGRILMCVDAWTDTFSDDGPEPLSTWREVTAEEQHSAEYARLQESIRREQEADRSAAANRAAARRAIRERMEQTGEAQAAREEYERMPTHVDPERLNVVTQEDMDRLDRIFDW